MKELKMFSVHQNAQLLETEYEETKYSFDEEEVNQLSVSSSVDQRVGYIFLSAILILIRKL